MATPLDLPLPEVTVEDFRRAWTRFELVASAKGWDENKQKTILPALLRGKLVDYYVDLSEESRASLNAIKKALMEKSGLAKDSLSAGRLFITRDQGAQEKVTDFADELKKLFVQAYPDEATTSAILLQRFLTGLRTPISRQLLLRGKPETLVNAVKDAREVEYALEFGTSGQKPDTQAINTVTVKSLESASKKDENNEALRQTLEKMTLRMEALETQLKGMQLQNNQRRKQQPYQQNDSSSRGRGRGYGGTRLVCWTCQEEGHIRANCPLNFNRPVGPVANWPRDKN